MSQREKPFLERGLVSDVRESPHLSIHTATDGRRRASDRDSAAAGMALLEQHAILFDTASRVVQPHAWVPHIPFAFLSIALLHPRVFVELGVHSGNSFNAFCQAFKRLGVSGSCHGVDTFVGDDHAGRYGEDILSALAAHQQLHYAEFAQLLRMTFDEALASFSDGSVDLLHIDGLHTYEAVRHDFERWLPKMSARGTILFHDTQVRGEHFGVWRLWEELRGRYPSCEFRHGHGLGVLAVGTQVPTPMLDLIAAVDEHSLFARFFETVGELQLRRAELGALAERKPVDSALRQVQSEVATVAAQIQASVDGNQALLNELRTLLRDRIADQHTTENLQAEIQRLNAQLTEKTATLTLLETKHRELTSEAATLQRVVEGRNRAIAEREHILSCLVQSTSWRITAPLRYVKSLFRSESP